MIHENNGNDLYNRANKRILEIFFKEGLTFTLQNAILKKNCSVEVLEMKSKGTQTVEPIRDKKKILAIKRNLKEEGSARNYLLFVMGINTALRISDLLKLKINDVINGKGEINDYLHLNIGKTKKNAKIALNSAIREALEYYIEKEKIINTDAYLFKSERSNKPIDRIRAYNLIQKWIQDAGLEGEKYGTHSLRKTWGYQARKHGISIEQISQKLGHKSTSVTKRYIGINQEEINQIENDVCL